jgi:predicted outer membrane repeat protein
MIAGNHSGGDGGVFYGSSNASPTFKSCVIKNNSASLDGGVFYGNSSCNAQLLNCTVMNNTAGSEGGALYCTDGSHSAALNTIFWRNTASTGPTAWIGGSTASSFWIAYSDVENGQGSIYVQSGSTLNWMDGMIDADPLFRYPPADDYHLSPGSPCIDTGDPYHYPDPGETDMDGEDRMGNERVDMGADEYYE